MIAGRADPDHPRKDGLRPLFMAAYKGHNSTFKALLEGGANMSIAIDPNDGEPAIPCRCCVVHRARVWHVCAAPLAGETVLGMACRMGNFDQVSMILAIPSSKDILDRGCTQGATPLSWACQNGHPRIVKALLHAGADKEKLNGRGGSPLMLSVKKSDRDHIACVQELIDAGVDINQVDSPARDMPVTRTLIEGNLEAAEMLLKRGAKVNHRNAMGMTPLDLMVILVHTPRLQLRRSVC